jgi:hypothetical protein
MSSSRVTSRRGVVRGEHDRTEKRWEDEEWMLGLRDTEYEPEIDEAGLDSSEVEA